MFRIPGQAGKDVCDQGAGHTRRDVLRVGGAGMLGLSLGTMFQAKALAEAAGQSGGPGWGKAKSVIMVYLQGGPSHLDLWDPKENVPDNVRSAFKTIPTKTPGRALHRDPAEARQGERQVHDDPLDELHAERAVQPHRGHLPDDDRLHDRQGQSVRPAGAAEPEGLSRTSDRNIVRLRPTDEPMLPFVMLPRPLQESNVVGKGGTAGFLGKAFDPYTLYPAGDDMDMDKMARIKIDDLQLRPEVFSAAPQAPRQPARGDQRADAGDRQGGRRLQARRVLRPGART